jgi:phosphoglycolate phosphatase-like HAD superfamily hydrolase
MASAAVLVSKTGTAAAGALLRAAPLVFWDFDGVIKDSVEVKSVGFERLFLPYGAELAARVRRHHEAHSGVSRFEKLRVYLEWAGEPVTDATVERFCEQFSALVMQAVIDAAWVPGVREYLRANHARQRFVLVTATPATEIAQILDALGLRSCFVEVHGAPTAKADAIGAALQRFGCAPSASVMVGDAEADLRAARAHGVPFLLRRTPLNRALQESYSGASFEDLADE